MSQLSLGQFLAAINAQDATLGRALEKIVKSINSLGRTLGAEPVGSTQQPTPISGITLQASAPTQNSNVSTATSEVLHWTINHPGEVKIGIRYFSEVDTSPNFTNPHVIDHGSSRTGIITLPTYASATAKESTTPTNYYLRSYSQMPGSKPTKPFVFGGLSGATAINMGGTSVCALLASTGSGTAPTNGSRGNSGLGRTLVGVPAVTPKRSIV